MADKLPQELVESIQKCLPVKSLVRFRSVCTAWDTLFTDARFINLHANHSSGQPPRRSSTESHLIKHPSIDTILATTAPNTHVHIFLDACKGLVAFFYMSDNFAAQEIVVWNPATKLAKILPHSSAVSVSGAATSVSLGFGCDAKGDFKAVRIFSFSTKTMEAEVYSSVADSWSTVSVQGFDGFTLKHKRHIAIVNGNPYWFASTNVSGGEKDSFLGFDTTRMEFKVVPNLPNNSEEDMVLVDWKGSLAIVTCVKKRDDWLGSIDIWMYHDDETVWKKDFTFGATLEVEVSKCIACSKFGKILFGCKDGRVLIFDSDKECFGVSQLSKLGDDYTSQHFHLCRL